MRISRITAGFFSLLVLASACSRQGHVTQIDYGFVQLDSTASDSSTSRLIAPYKRDEERLMNEVLGKTDVAMVKEKDKPESLLGNFVADVLFKKTSEKYMPSDRRSPDICLLNNGGLRNSLPKGEITRGKIYELMPFDNEIVVVTISGEKMKDLLNYVAGAGGVPVAGMKMGIKGKVPMNVLIGGQPVDDKKTYKVITSDYLANGGDKMTFLASPIAMETTGYKIRDALIDYFKAETANGHIVTAAMDGRIYYETK